jgi:cytochrome b561
MAEKIMLRNTHDSFGSIAKIFHWLIALCIVGMLMVGWIMGEVESSSTKMMLYGLHKSTGVIILLLALLRLAWRLLNPIPQLPSSLHPWHYCVAKLSPLALYTLLFLMPLSGFILSQAAGYPVTVYNLFTLPVVFSKNIDLSKTGALIHKYGAFILVGALALHIIAALYHHFILKTNVLQRMLPSWFQRS